MPPTHHLGFLTTLQTILIVGAQCFFLASPSFAADRFELEEGGDLWAVMAGINIGVDVLDVSASSFSSMTSTPNIRPTSQLAKPAEGDERIFAPSVGYDMGFLTPRFADHWAAPRFFAHINFEAALAQEVIPAASDARGLIRPPGDSNDRPLDVFTETGVIGQGSENLININPFQLRAGVGLAFAFDVYGRTLRIKPSFEYMRKEMEARAGLTRIIQTQRSIMGGPIRIQGSLFAQEVRVATIDVEAETVLHGIGPGLELEMDAWRSGPTIISLFGGFNAYKFLGSLKESVTGQAVRFPDATGTNPPITTGTPETATFRFRYDSWSYRINAGIRIRWQPEF